MVTRTFTLVVAPEDAGQRLDRVLLAHLPELGRRRAGALFAAGAVRIGKRRARKGDAARAGDTVIVELGAPNEALPEPQAPLHIVRQTPQLLVVDKPAGQPSAPRSGDERGCLANALVGRFPELVGVGYGPLEPGLVHRLDTQTSGLLLAARSARVFERLRGELSQARLTKRYLAIATGDLPERAGFIRKPLRQDPGNPRRVVVCATADAARAARDATTHWRVTDSRSPFTLLELTVARAFRHQIRVHLAHLGCPIAGDRVYGGAAQPALGERHALHASALSWEGDEEVAAFHVESPLPPELAALLGR